jgi:hypothetical protein
MTHAKIYTNDGASEAPDTTHFVVARNGLFLRKKSDWVDAIVPARGVDGLKPVETSAQLLLPRLKSTVFAKAVLFFNEVYKQKKTEAAVLLHYSPKHGWDLSVPTQQANGAFVKYDAAGRLPGYRCVGTMHSHCAMSAFHSSTDTRDEAAQDGVHITIGRLNNFPTFGMDAEIVVNGTRFPLPHEHIVYVRPEEPKKRPGLLSFMFSKHDQLYTFPFGVVRDWTVPQEWVDRVESYTYKPPAFMGESDTFEPFGNGGWWSPHQFAGQKGKE